MPTHPVRPPSWIDEAPITFSNSIDIAASPSAVWERIADHETWTQWFSGLDRVEVTGSPTGVGGNRRVTVKRLAIDEEFTAWDVDERFAFAIIGSKLPFLHALAEDVHIEPTETGCRLTYRQGIECKRGFTWLGKLAFGSLGTQTREAIAELKVLVER